VLQDFEYHFLLVYFHTKLVQVAFASIQASKQSQASLMGPILTMLVTPVMSCPNTRRVQNSPDTYWLWQMARSEAVVVAIKIITVKANRAKTEYTIIMYYSISIIGLQQTFFTTNEASIH
jgi:hypothetical protein